MKARSKPRVTVIFNRDFEGAETDPENKARGYGLLLLILAGFPLRITHQDMLMVLGAALVFAPRIERDVPFFIHLPDRMGPSGSLY